MSPCADRPRPGRAAPSSEDWLTSVAASAAAATRAPADLPTLVVAGAWAAILLVLLGALAAGLAVGVATALGWALWRYWPQLGQADTTTWSVLHEVDRGLQAARRPAEQRGPRQQRRGAPEQ